MNVIDIIILIFLAFGAILGFKRGFTRQLLSLIGIFVIIVLSFILKNPISVLLYNNLPFFNLGGIFKDITILNILIYEIIAFLIVFLILLFIFKILIKITNVFEKILKMTIILGIPSKILGAILGIIEGIIFTFIVMYILSLTVNDCVNNSKIGNFILDKTPILNKIADNTLSTYNEIIELKDEYEDTNNLDEYNEKAIKKMIENKVITRENVERLINQGKIKNVNL